MGEAPPDATQPLSAHGAKGAGWARAPAACAFQSAPSRCFGSKVCNRLRTRPAAAAHPGSRPHAARTRGPHARPACAARTRTFASPQTATVGLMTLPNWLASTSKWTKPPRPSSCALCASGAYLVSTPVVRSSNREPIATIKSASWIA
eukprot:4119702-Prymnesium_polylepis.1